MKKLLLFVSLFMTASMYAGLVTVSKSVSELAFVYGWEQGGGNNCYLKFALDENITMYASSGNAKYLKNETEECMRYYQGSNKGAFTIRAKAGVIIQSVQFDYYNSGVITNNYGTGGKSIAEANQVKAGVPFKVDGNKVVLYVGCTTAETGKQVRITKYSVTYFVPEENTSVLKTAADLGKNLGLKDGTPYQDIALNPVISMHADNGGTMKYYTSGNFNFYRWTGPFYVRAREGAKINYVKITYGGGPRATLTQNWGKDGKYIAKADRIDSDSMIYVNGRELKLFIGDTAGTGTSPTLSITKIYVNYEDSDAFVEYFDNCPVTSSDSTVEFAGVDNWYDWKLTNFNRDSARRVSYEQSIMLRAKANKAGEVGKLQMMNEEGGFKEIYFDWFGSSKDTCVKFIVKAGGETFTVDSAALKDYNRILFSKSGIKSNGAFSIEMDPTSGSQLEFGPISITPYLLFVAQEDSVDTQEVSSYDLSDVLVDNTEEAANIVYSIESDETGGATISGSVVNLSGSQQDGKVVVKATWEQVSTSMTLNVKKGSTPTGVNEVHNAQCTMHNGKVIVNGQLRIYRDGKMYNAQGQKR